MVALGKAEAARVAILAGIDEAGFGPLLGPLVVSSAAFSVPPALLDEDLWRVFRKSVGKSRKHLAGRLLIADSKKAFNRDQGLGHLERTCLAVLECFGKRPAEMTELLTLLCPDCVPRVAEYPWYQDIRQCRLAPASDDTRIASKVFVEDLRAQGTSLVELRARCLDVAYFNRMVGDVRNKAQVLFIAGTQLIQVLLNRFPDDEIHVQVDRQGGRTHYRENLLRSFPDTELTIVRESDECSVYELLDGTRKVRLTFEVKADDRHLPVSLASMVSKYVRELLMDCVNGYFTKMDGGLRPTAGYWQDGRRFVEDLRSRLPHLAIDADRLIRCR
jgi:ribonuclease HII